MAETASTPDGLPLDGTDTTPPDSGSTGKTAVRLLQYAISVNRGSFWAAVLASLGGSLTEGFGLVLLLPLLAIAGMNFSTASTAGRLGGVMQRLLAESRLPHSLWLPAVLAFFLLIAGVRSVLRRWQSMMVYATTVRVELALSHRVYAAVVNARWAFLVRQRSGRMTHLLTEQLRRLADAISLLLTIINLMCLTLLYLAIALKLSAPMTLLVLAIGSVLLLLQRRSLNRVRLGGEQLTESVGAVYAATEEHLLNIKSVKTCNAEARDVQIFASLCDTVARDGVSTVRHQTVSAFRFEMGSLLALGAAIFVAIGVLHVSAPAMLLLLAVFTRLMPQLAAMQSQTHELAAMLPAYDHILAIEAECLRHAEPAESDKPGSEPSLCRELRFEDVWFAYRDDQVEANYVLRGIDLAIATGTLTALAGPSGAGKSTVADLANGLLDPSRGQVLLDGVPISPFGMRMWRSQVGYVGQDTLLFHRSIRENLLWAKPGATEGEMREALLLAAADFVDQLSNGIDSVVGDRGILLSSGQRQRISIARALLRKPSLLILDEATNALDMENEARVLDALREAIAKSQRIGESPLTVLMIAHRPSAIRRADCVIELEDGRVLRTSISAEASIETR